MCLVMGYSTLTNSAKVLYQNYFKAKLPCFDFNFNLQVHILSIIGDALRAMKLLLNKTSTFFREGKKLHILLFQEK